MLPQRVVLGIMGFLGIVVSFLMRQSLSIAITEMVVPVDKKGISNESLICPADYATFESSNDTQNVCASHISFWRFLHFVSIECNPSYHFIEWKKV